MKILPSCSKRTFVNGGYIIKMRPTAVLDRRRADAQSTEHAREPGGDAPEGNAHGHRREDPDRQVPIQKR